MLVKLSLELVCLLTPRVALALHDIEKCTGSHYTNSKLKIRIIDTKSDETKFNLRPNMTSEISRQLTLRLS